MTQGHNTARRSAPETKCTLVINAEVGKLWCSTQSGKTTTVLLHQRRACVRACVCVRVAESAVRGRAGVYRGGGGVAQAGSIGAGVQERQGAVFFTDHSSSRGEWTKCARKAKTSAEHEDSSSQQPALSLPCAPCQCVTAHRFLRQVSRNPRTYPASEINGLVLVFIWRMERHCPLGTTGPCFCFDALRFLRRMPTSP